jgi:hypothetical protein
MMMVCPDRKYVCSNPTCRQTVCQHPFSALERAADALAGGIMDGASQREIMQRLVRFAEVALKSQADEDNP